MPRCAQRIVRCISVVSDEVETWDGITTGLSENRITAAYDEVIEAGSFLYLYYHEGNMLEKKDLPPQENCLIYGYSLADGRIGMIQICDSEYAKKRDKASTDRAFRQFGRLYCFAFPVFLYI